MKKDILGGQIRAIELGKMARAIDQTTYYTKPSASIVVDILSHPLFPSYLQHMHGLLGTQNGNLTEGIARLTSLGHIIRTQIESGTDTQLHSEDFNAALNLVRKLKVS